MPGFLWTLPCVPFPLTDFVVYPFAAISFNCEYEYILSPAIPSSESPSLGVILEPCKQLPLIIYNSLNINCN